MARARLHIICGNCGCNTEFTYTIEPEARDLGDGTFEPEVFISCGNCTTLHYLSDTVEESPKS